MIPGQSELLLCLICSSGRPAPPFEHLFSGCAGQTEMMKIPHFADLQLGLESYARLDPGHPTAKSLPKSPLNKFYERGPL
jgi:hypothetical protein